MEVRPIETQEICVANSHFGNVHSGNDVYEKDH